MLGDRLEFADTNVVLYALACEEPKRTIARKVLGRSPIVSVQVLSEASNTLYRKYGIPRSEIVKQLGEIAVIVDKVVPIDETTLRLGWNLWQRSQFSWYDSLIIASALTSDCHVLYSEDFQHGQVIDERLRILNPFLVEVIS